jgi:hypothetical protein
MRVSILGLVCVYPRSCWRAPVGARWPGFFITPSSFDESGPFDLNGVVRRKHLTPTKPRPNVAPGRGFSTVVSGSRESRDQFRLRDNRLYGYVYGLRFLLRFERNVE